MPGLDHGDTLERPAVAVARHRHADKPFTRQLKTAEIYFFGDFRHRTGGFSGGEHDEAAAWRLRQQRRQARRRMRRCYRSAI